ncbi:OstA-like protein [Chryseolinea sp. T2]|uniref:OstA-like protein n=1 Tax=Chryseolinea sp. T2 TaxID=3129255 RepID=UPI00307727AC
MKNGPSSITHSTSCYFSGLCSGLILSILVCVVLVVTSATEVSAQKRLKLKHGDQLRSGKDAAGNKFDRVIGNVIFNQNTTTIYCDSAYFYKQKNSIEAFGHIRITEGDSVTITGNRLEYDGNTKHAKLRKNVVFTKLATSTLYTEFLDFSRPDNLAFYYNGGKLVDSINVLTSSKGYYNVNNNMASFKKDVVVTHPDYIMKADSLQYNSKSKVIYFRTPTNVVHRKDSSTFVYQSGEYDTRARHSVAEQGTGETSEYKVVSKDYQLDDMRKIYKLRGDVVMTSKKDNLLIFGQAADYYRAKGYSKVYNRAYAAKITDNNDTLFIAADTLVSIENEDESKKRLLAYNNVRIYKSDMQGIADSLEYRTLDSALYFYKQPVLWTQGNQMSADSIQMILRNQTIDKVYLNANAFVISRDTLLNFNQIKGRHMTAEFKNQKINRVYVNGNGESIYFLLSEKEGGAMGMNRIICSDITIRFSDGQVKTLSFYRQPDARFIPPHELKKEEMTLRGFTWKEDKKPERSDVVGSRP